MDDFRLRVFVTAARTLSFTRAAAALFISQPAVSKHIGELESRYGVRLFVRRGNSLELTEAGRRMLHAAEEIGASYRRLEYEMGLCSRRVSGELRLGASTTAAQYLLPGVLARFSARFPEVRVSLRSGNSEEVERALGAAEIDLGVVESMSRRQGFRYSLFAPDELVLVARAKGPHARLERVTPGELCGLPLVLREEGSGTLEVIAAALAGAGVRLPMLRVAMRLGSTEAIKGYVRNSDALAVVSVISVRDELRNGLLRVIDIEEVSLRRDFSFVGSDSEPAPIVRQFIDFVRLSDNL